MEAFGAEPAQVDGGGPAVYYRIPGAAGTVGIIAAHSANFCDHRRRVRLGADGFLHTCLAEEGGVDLRGPLRRGASGKELRELFRRAVFAKPREGDFRWEKEGCHRAMSRLGG
jgi:cyclic pyranopterin phosphate synthase